MLATSDLWFRYQDEPVLKGLNLDFSLSPVTGLVGANGCGKSTLFMNLSGLLRPQGASKLRRFLRCASKLRRFFRTLNSRFFILISIAILRLVYVIWGCRKRKSRAGANAG
ncbi:ATPase component CbiO [Salmonella enterica subsp. enterica serovar Give str. S5-487]|nr:ATPase component CbiO [Salmonella enterica subsp. enterica serovar Give str. S5-487]